jgi:heme/copper-type cytochrome/quinol oxidase subunit 3
MTAAPRPLRLVTAPASPGEARRARSAERTAMLGMVLFLASWAMLFAALFFAYGVLRVRALAWPPPDLPAVPRGLPTLATGVLAAASLLVETGLRRLRAGLRGAAFGSVLGSALLGALFLALQITVWRQLWHAGLRLEAGPYPSVIFGLTVFHGLHVAVGLAALLYVAVRLRAGAYTAVSHIPLRLWSIYLHMVGVIWAVMYVLLVLL